ncbi:MAG: S-adenosylmethionine:tRNA ribosyltransferase-isomerase [Candidatus Eremiobacteraeota bacterium]|nr:S-adenosylmethionine:tRNA ribosyltransferase-isomerase [Candidatus Eremiobacteraeota bacterium]
MSLAFSLPQALEASAPPEARGLARDEVSLLVSNAHADSHEVHTFNELANFLDPGDLLVVNDSATIPAALEARYHNEEFPLHLSTKFSDFLWLVEPRSHIPFAPGAKISLPEDSTLTLLGPFGALRPRLWYAQLDIPDDVASYLNRNGRAITYNYLRSRWPLSYYQTIFAKEPGSVEMPSAARPFSLRTLETLRERNIGIATITLHCSVASPESREAPVMEWMSVSPRTAEIVTITRARQQRIVAVGTTAVRALESATDDTGEPIAFRGWTGHVVNSKHPPRIASALLTGFHEPQASHLAMLEAFTPPKFLRNSYDAALQARLLWHEFGDVHLVLP